MFLTQAGPRSALGRPDSAWSRRSPLRTAIIGCGQWGMNLARSAVATGAFTLQAAIDLRADNAQTAKQALGAAWCSTDLRDVWRDNTIDAVMVATPAATHFAVASQALRAGKHTLVEKPLALSAVECAALGLTADHVGRTLMVGHTFMYSPHVFAVRQVIEGGRIGDIHYMHLQRLAFGRFREDVNVTWNLGPHDVSILNYWAGVEPVAVRCVERYCTRDTLADFANITIDYGRFFGNVHLSCADPRKVRTGTVAGSLGGVTYDDIAKQVSIVERKEGPSRTTQLAISNVQPLQEECLHFASCVADGAKPRTDSAHAVAVVAVLAAATTSAAHGGEWVPIAHRKSPRESISPGAADGRVTETSEP